MLRPAVPLVVLVAFLAVGCGSSSEDSSEDFKGPQRAVAVAVERLEDAGREDDAGRICQELLAKSLLARQRQGGTNCKTAVDDALEDADSFDIEVKKVTIKGLGATVQVKSGSGDQEKDDTLTLQREGTVWKIASLGQ